MAFRALFLTTDPAEQATTTTNAASTASCARWRRSLRSAPDRHPILRSDHPPAGPCTRSARSTARLSRRGAPLPLGQRLHAGAPSQLPCATADTLRGRARIGRPQGGLCSASGSCRTCCPDEACLSEKSNQGPSDYTAARKNRSRAKGWLQAVQVAISESLPRREPFEVGDSMGPDEESADEE